VFTGPRLLEIGGGPIIMYVAAACTRFPEIIFSEYSEQSRQSVKCWIENDKHAFDWSHRIKYICTLEGNGDKWQERSENLRCSIKEIVHCDVHVDNPLAPNQYDPFDAIVTALCLEAACPDKASYSNAMRNVASLLKPGGVLFLCGVLNQSFYAVGANKYWTLSIDEVFIKSAMTDAGFIDIESSVIPAPNPDGNNVSDFGGLIYITAKKNGQNTIENESAHE
uniref:Indolethylamine N-methyltransferase-like n=1 Tax=Saccoglossus kowalevskii TaxID=10224 RepID=A0ABM0MBA2_SACKO